MVIGMAWDIMEINRKFRETMYDDWRPTVIQGRAGPENGR
jgi:hypothetical protein